MHYYEIAPNQIVRAGQDYFTYQSNDSLEVGQIVLIEVGKKQLPGIIFREVKKPEYKTKDILSVIEKEPLPKQLLKLAIWMSEYYTTPLAVVIQTILPSGVTKKRRDRTEKATLKNCRERTNILFNKDQSRAIEELEKFSKGTFLLQGVTGSGKTTVYIEIIKKALAKSSSAIVLVPEIALTSQLISEFANHFDNLVMTHSKMTEAERHQAWKKCLVSEKPLVVIGPRSALFMPLKNIGVIVIDEAHEPSLKQEHSPRYSALRAATILGRGHSSLVIFGSATPSIADRYVAEKSDKPILRLSKVARPDNVPPEISIVDMTKRQNFKQHRFLSDSLLSQIESTLENKGQVLIFHNRRGGASTTLCEACGWTAECPNCFLPMTLHLTSHSLKCHVCGNEQKIPTCCPNCKEARIIHKGIGTQLIEHELKKIFPKARIARFDGDNKKDAALDKMYDEIYSGNIDIIVGTQVVAKGLDLPKLRTVGVIQADAGLSIPDFSANERTFQLLDQVIGRVGRNDKQTQVIVQTYKPDHPSIFFGAKQDYESFYKLTLEERKKGLFPPFTYLLKLTCSFKTEVAAIKNTRNLAQKIKQEFPDVKVFGPAPALYERYDSNYRWQIIIKSPKRNRLTEIAHLTPPNNWQYDLDPPSLL